MATGSQGEFVAVVNDTDPKSNGKAYSLKITGNNYSQILGKKIGDVVDGIATEVSALAQAIRFVAESLLLATFGFEYQVMPFETS